MQLRNIHNLQATLGNNDTIVAKPWDHDLFNSLINIKSLNKSNTSLKVFHAYSGHGPYIKNIPIEFRDQLMNILINLTQEL